MRETLLSPSNVLLFGKIVQDLRIVEPEGNAQHSPFIVNRTGGIRELESQILREDAHFARIYGFSYEGTYHDLPEPPLFLVHGMGEPVTPHSPAREGDDRPTGAARAPSDPSLSGVAAAEFQFADEWCACVGRARIWRARAWGSPFGQAASRRWRQ
jgi:hypothetical protein